VVTPQQSLAIAFAHAPYFKPGASYHYSNTNYLLLGVLLEKLTGMPLAKVYQQLIFEPLGMRHTSFPELADARLPLPHPTGYLYGTSVQSLNVLLAALSFDFLNSAVLVPASVGPVDATNWNPPPYWSAGAGISTLRDLAIWAKAYGTGALLKPATYREQIALLPNSTYGLGIAESPRGFLRHDGAVPGYSSIIGYSPELGTTIVVLLNNEITPNTLLVSALPVTNLAAIIQQALYPKVKGVPTPGPALEPALSTESLCPAV
jgi:D-alanyl-D-alanine carboxypeptidase